MKKITITLLFILVIGFCIFADSFDKPQLLVGTGNDKFTYGISQNDDDQLTYSGIIGFYKKNYSIVLDLSAYTDRGSFIDETFRSGRLDTISLSGTYKNRININSNLYVNLNNTAGIGLAGKFNFDIIQNLHHKNVGVDPVYIPYDWAGVKVTPVYGLNIGVNLDLEKISFSLSADYLNTIFLASTKKAALKVNYLDLLSAELGYRRGKNFSASYTIGKTIEFQNGPYVDINLLTSPLRIRWEYYPTSKFGYGTFYFDALSFFRKRDWGHSDIVVDVTLLKLYEHELIGTSIRVPYNDKLSFMAGVEYVSGFPEATVTDSRIQRNYALYEAGVYYSPIKWYVSPYLQAKIGCGSFQLTYLNNIREEKTDDVIVPAELAFVGDVRLGLQILSEGLVAFGNSSYSLQVFVGSHIVPWRENVSSILTKDNCHEETWTPKMFSPYFGFGLSIGIDSKN